jgi:hypothetical protein
LQVVPRRLGVRRSPRTMISSTYAESLVMPSWPPRSSASRAEGSKTSAKFGGLIWRAVADLDVRDDRRQRSRRGYRGSATTDAPTLAMRTVLNEWTRRPSAAHQGGTIRGGERFWTIAEQHFVDERRSGTGGVQISTTRPPGLTPRSPGGPIEVALAPAGAAGHALELTQH